MKNNSNWYGVYVGDKPVHNRNDLVYASRKRGAITTDAELIEFCEKVTCGWTDLGIKRGFLHFYLSDSEIAQPRLSLTDNEFKRLKEIQKVAREEEKRKEDARQWKKVRTIRFEDGSLNEMYEDKDGNKKTVSIFCPKSKRRYGDEYCGY